MAEYKRPGNTGRNAERKPGRKPEPRKERGADRSFGRGNDSRTDGSAERKPYGDGDRKPYGDRGRKPYGDRERKPYGDRERKPYGDRERKPYGDGDHKPYGDRERKSYGDGDHKSYGDRDRKPYGDKERKSYGDRERKPYGDRERKPYGDKERKPYESKFSKAAKKSTEKKPSFLDEQKPDVQISEDLDKLEGRNSVMEAIKSGRSINRILVSKGEKEGSINQIIALARQNHIIIQEIDRSKLDEMSETHAHQGIIALTSAKDYVEVDDILKAAADSGRPPFIVILDGITDAYNLGSILRTSNAAGVHGVIIPKRRAVGLTSVVSKASAGAIEYVPVARVTNIVQTIEYLKTKEIWVAGTDADGERAYYEHDLTGGIALVIGSEGEGMGKLVREACDFTVNIPMLGDISSLNAAVAGAVVIYDIVRQRNMKQR